MSLGEIKKNILFAWKIGAFTEDITPPASHHHQVLPWSRTRWVGGFATLTKRNDRKRLTPVEGKMSSMPQSKSRGSTQRERRHLSPYVTFQLAPFCGGWASRVTPWPLIVENNHSVKFDIFSHMFFLHHMHRTDTRCFPCDQRSSWPLVLSCFFFSGKIECCNRSADEDGLVAVEETLWQLKDKY